MATSVLQRSSQEMEENGVLDKYLMIIYFEKSNAWFFKVMSDELRLEFLWASSDLSSISFNTDLAIRIEMVDKKIHWTIRIVRTMTPSFHQRSSKKIVDWVFFDLEKNEATQVDLWRTDVAMVQKGFSEVPFKFNQTCRGSIMHSMSSTYYNQSNPWTQSKTPLSFISLLDLWRTNGVLAESRLCDIPIWSNQTCTESLRHSTSTKYVLKNPIKDTPVLHLLSGSVAVSYTHLTLPTICSV